MPHGSRAPAVRLSPRNSTRTQFMPVASWCERCGRSLASAHREHAQDTAGGLAVPQCGERPRPGRILERAECGLEDRPRFAPHEAVRPVRECDRTLRVLAKREAGDAEGGRLLLHATAIREDEPRADQQ